MLSKFVWSELQIRLLRGCGNQKKEWMRLSEKLRLSQELPLDWDVPLRSGSLTKVQLWLRQMQTTQTGHHSRESSVILVVRDIHSNRHLGGVCGEKTFDAAR